MIELRDVSIGNNRHNVLVSGQTLTLDRATLTALTGRNGCGKSTLLRVMAGLQRPLGGRVLIDGRDIGEMSARQRAMTVAVVTPDAVEARGLTCRELVGLGRSPHTGLFGRLDSEDRKRVAEALDATGMSGFAERHVAELSDGEKRRVMLAHALAQDTPVILLDEPTSFLDVPGRFEICELLSRLAHEQGRTIVYSTHELQPALHFSDRILFMRPKGLMLATPADMSARHEFIQTMRLDLLG